MNWTHAEALDLFVLCWAAGLALLVLADVLRVWWSRRRAVERHADDWCAEGNSR